MWGSFPPSGFTVQIHGQQQERISVLFCRAGLATWGTDDQLIPHRCPLPETVRRQFQDTGCFFQEGTSPPGPEPVDKVDYHPVLVQEYYVDGEAHKIHMDSTAGHKPEGLTRGKGGAKEESPQAGEGTIGDYYPPGQDKVFCFIIEDGFDS